MQTDSCFEAIPLTTGIETNLGSLAKLIQQSANSCSKILIDQQIVDRSEVANPLKARDLLGFEPQIDIQEGIRRFVSIAQSKNDSVHLLKS